MRNESSLRAETGSGCFSHNDLYYNADMTPDPPCTSNSPALAEDYVSGCGFDRKTEPYSGRADIARINETMDGFADADIRNGSVASPACIDE